MLLSNIKITPLLEAGAAFNPEFTGRENIFLNGSIYGIPREEIKRIYREEHADTILSNGTPFEDEIKTLKEEIARDEHTFVCITSQHPICSHHTLTWLGKQGLNFQTVYFRKGMKKWMVECDYLIDDSPNNWKHWKNGRGSDHNFILMNQKWNEKLKATNRVNSIEEALNIIYDK